MHVKYIYLIVARDTINGCRIKDHGIRAQITDQYAIPREKTAYEKFSIAIELLENQTLANYGITNGATGKVFGIIETKPNTQ